MFLHPSLGTSDRIGHRLSCSIRHDLVQAIHINKYTLGAAPQSCTTLPPESMELPPEGMLQGADMNFDGITAEEDAAAFEILSYIGHPAADLNNDDAVDAGDVIQFYEEYANAQGGGQ